MRIRDLLVSAGVSAAMAIFTVPATAATVRECMPAQAATESQISNSKSEAYILKDYKSDAEQARYHADQLQSFAQTDLDWSAQATQMDALRHDLNDMGNKVCQLENIRSMVGPRQQAEIDHMTAMIRLMADNTEDAIVFGNSHRGEMWLARYRDYTNSIYNEAVKLEHSADRLVSHERAEAYRNLEHRPAFSD